MTNASPEWRQARTEKLLSDISKDIQKFRDKQISYFQTYLDDEEYAAALEVLGLQKIDGGSIVQYIYHDTETGITHDSAEMLPSDVAKYESMHKPERIIENIVDQYWNYIDEYNSYAVTLAYAYDAETVVLLGSSLEDLGEDEYSSGHWLAMVRADEFERREGWEQWDIKKKLTSEDVIEKKEITEDSIDLWKLDIGTTLRMLCGDGKRSDLYDCVVVNAGQEPLVTMSMIRQDGTVSFTDQVFCLRGGGRWTNRWNNPMVTGTDPKLAINYGAISLGDLPVIYHNKDTSGAFWTLEPVLGIAVQDSFEA